MFNKRILQMFDEAARSQKLKATATDYLDLRKFFSDSSERGRKNFRVKFTHYYGLAYAGLRDEWRDRYFDILFDKIKLDVPYGPRLEPYGSILLDLYRIPRRQGDKALQFSFVSKLVAFHDEKRPLYDSKVEKFFGIGPPHFGNNEFRISGFVDNLNEIARRYGAWLQNKEFAAVLDTLRAKYPSLAGTHPVRLCDFIVHKTKATQTSA